MNEYATLTEFKRVVLPAGETTDDAMLAQMLEDAARWLDRRTGRVFYPRIQTRYYDLPPDPTVLKLDDDLLAVTTLYTDNGTTLVAAADYVTACGRDYNTTPYDRLVLLPTGTQVALGYDGSVLRSQVLTGTWGYHEDYANAWESSNDTLKTKITSATTTTVEVNDADGADLWGRTPRFQAGQIIKLDSEYMYIVAVTAAASTNTLTVRRGWNGSTAASLHDGGVAIYIWRPMADVRRAHLDLCAWLYRHKDLAETGQVAYPSLGVTLNPDRLPSTVQEVIARYRRPL